MANNFMLLICDWRNSVTGSTSSKSHSSAYDTFGFNPQSHPYGCRFNGQYQPPHSADYLLGNGYRAYLTRLRKFITPDHWSPFGRGGLNAYAYCAGDPVNFTDPSGHIPLGMLAGKIKPTHHKQLRNLLANKFPQEFLYHASPSELVNFVIARNNKITAAYTDLLGRSARRSNALLSGKIPLHTNTVVNNLARKNNAFVQSLIAAPRDQSWTRTFSTQILEKSGNHYRGDLATTFISDVIGTPGKAPSRRVLRSLLHITTNDVQLQRFQSKPTSPSGLQNTTIRKA